MQRSRESTQKVLMTFTDIIIAVLAFYLAYHFRGHLNLYGAKPITAIHTFIWLLSVSIICHLFLYEVFELDRHDINSFSTLFKNTFKSFLFEALIITMLVFVFKLKATSRYLILFYLSFNYLFVLITRSLFKSIFNKLFNSSQSSLKVLLIGDDLGLELENFKQHGPIQKFEIIGAASGQAPSKNYTHLGDLSNLGDILKNEVVDALCVCTQDLTLKQLDLISSLSQTKGLSLYIPYITSSGPGSFVRHQTGNVTWTEFSSNPSLTSYPIIKRIMDIILGVTGLAFFLITLPIIAIIIKLDSKGPIFFIQTRIGRNGRKFKFFKYRTMFQNADESKGSLIDDNQRDGPVFKIVNDPRVTRFGQFLRKTSLDEVPQFLNVLKGEMSLIGPRPPTCEEYEKYNLEGHRKLSIRPGITGLWQVSSNKESSSFEQTLKLDLEYIDSLGPINDLSILLKTIIVIIQFKNS